MISNVHAFFFFSLFFSFSFPFDTRFGHDWVFQSLKWLRRQKDRQSDKQEEKIKNGLLSKKLKTPLETLSLQVHLNVNELYISNHIWEDKW